MGEIRGEGDVDVPGEERIPDEAGEARDPDAVPDLEGVADQREPPQEAVNASPDQANAAEDKQPPKEVAEGGQERRR